MYINDLTFGSPNYNVSMKDFKIFFKKVGSLNLDISKHGVTIQHKNKKKYDKDNLKDFVVYLKNIPQINNNKTLEIVSILLLVGMEIGEPYGTFRVFFNGTDISFTKNSMNGKWDDELTYYFSLGIGKR